MALRVKQKELVVKRPVKTAARPKSASKAVKHERTGLEKVTKISKTAPLLQQPSSKEAKLRISEYVVAVKKHGSSFEIMSRGKIVAVLAPVDRIPKGSPSFTNINISDIAQSRRTFASVIHHGPYRILRNSVVGAALFTPRPTGAMQVQAILDQLEKLEVLKEAIENADERQKVILSMQKNEFQVQIELLRGVRLKADRRIESRLAALRTSGAYHEADNLEQEWKQIIADEDSPVAKP